uniref:DUF7344 domain-containing protein n=1 Tax=Halegenticoccus soli TaxID=1985678 RepID=UPI001E3BAB64|nr:ArsR family transcriptional regulator [Halegenticoccus soli]
MIRRLRATDSTTLSELSERIAAAEAGESPPRRVHHSVYATLHQTHLPKLDSLGVVAYDADEKTIRRGPAADPVIAFMDATPRADHRGRWACWYFALGLVGLLSFAARAVGVAPTGALGLVYLHGGLFSLLAVTAAYRCGRVVRRR